MFKKCFLILQTLLTATVYAKDPNQLIRKDTQKSPHMEFSRMDKIVDVTRKTIEYVDKVAPVSDQQKQEFETLNQLISADRDDTDAYIDACKRMKALRRKILFSHPALDFEKILINRNPPTKYSHNGDQHLGRHSRTGPGLTMLSNWKNDKPTVTPLLKDKLPAGATRNPDLNFDADKVVFAYCRDIEENNKQRYFLYEAAIDGSWVRQITGDAKDTFDTPDNRATVLIEDNDPCYLPNGDLMFISTRSQSFGRCHGGRYNPAWVLYRSDKDGGNIRQISVGNENEYKPAIMNDGRITFSRWEYTNRHEMYFHMLWWCHPDGTSVSNFYGNDTISPYMITEQRPIPGTNKVIATAMAHHSYTTGSIILIDTDKGENGAEPITRLTPETKFPESEVGFNEVEEHYSHPFAINEELFFVSKANHVLTRQGRTPPTAGRGIYLCDAFGGRELIYEDPTVASVSPIPVIKRKRPKMKPDSWDGTTAQTGTLFIQNAYLTRNDPDKIIKPGMIKSIRVIEQGVQPKRSRGALSATVRVEIPKKILGTVPVYEDGSAFFKVPVNKSIQLQILDKDNKAILTEKTFIYLKPGENRSCIGCHEKPGTAPVAGAVIASRKAPSELKPPAGPSYPGGQTFMSSVQPVLDRYCISCHGLDKTEKDINLIHNGDKKKPSSAMELINRGRHYIGDKRAMSISHSESNTNVSRPYDFFAAANKVTKMIMSNHGKTNMDQDSKNRIIEWFDINAQIFGDLYHNKIEYRSFDDGALKLLQAHIEATFGSAISKQPVRSLINVARPEESRILMAPLAQKAGGWEQLSPVWQSKNDPDFKKMAELIDACIIKKPTDNIYGWTPPHEAGAADKWIIEARKEYQNSVVQ